MEWFLGGMLNESMSCDNTSASQGIERCPFLRNINEPTNFSFSPAAGFPIPPRGTKGPIFEDGPNFDMAFRVFHGRDGVVPLTRRSLLHREDIDSQNATAPFNPLAAKAATISLSSFGFGPGGPFGFDNFANKWQKPKKNSSKKDHSSQGGGDSAHEARSHEWLETGQCPIAKSYRAVNAVLPLVAKALQPPPGVKFRCPPAIVAARAALARTALVKNLRPQPLPSKMLVIALMGMAANVPLGVWREHTKKFSPQWFVAVHAAVPFIAMLRKSVMIPKAAMALTIAASILGQTIGSRAERLRMKAAAAKADACLSESVPKLELDLNNYSIDGRMWEPLPLKAAVGESGASGGKCAPVLEFNKYYGGSGKTNYDPLPLLEPGANAPPAKAEVCF